MTKLSWERFAVIGTTQQNSKDAKPRLLAANCATLDQAAAQCKRYSLQGWGCQVMPVRIIAEPPKVEQSDTLGASGP